MIVIQANKITKSYNDIKILNEINFSINQNERVGLVGPNGVGKSTLMQCLSGEMPPDSGDVIIGNGIKYGYLEQLPEKNNNTTTWDIVMESYSELIEYRQTMHELEKQIACAEENQLEKLLNKYSKVTEMYERADGYSCESTARKILIGLGFNKEDFNKPYKDFSGGQKTRINLARLLALNPDLLLLDEPTNHLDINSIMWLEDFLNNYSGTLLIVSHDRTFLDNICTRILELNTNKVNSYFGNYTKYLKLKAEEDLTFARAYKKQQEKIKRTEEFIRKYRAGIKSKQARGRELQLQRMERLEADRKKQMSNWQINITNNSAHEVLQVIELEKTFEDNIIFKDINFKLTKGQKVALIGPNGCGKTTLLKTIIKEIYPENGVIKIGNRVKLAYFAQEYETINPYNTLLDELLTSFDITIQESRSYLGKMLFSGDDVFKTIDQLSGGEKARIAILKIIISGANFLVLDEPTNHLDIESCQLVEELLTEFPGTILFVSHDRSFIDQIADGILSMENGNIEYFPGNYSYYQEKINRIRNEEALLKKQEKAEKKVAKPRNEKKEKEKLVSKLNEKLNLIEEEIIQIEEEKTKIEEVLSDPDTYNNEEKAKSYTFYYHEIEEQYNVKYDEWEELSLQIDELNEEL
ncbi:Bis-ABC ATPase YheS [Candidatus Syntrophocurvum alkaliphilum]|uniref:Bis-ABC ATPase YheS n=1 Tax=Candidatus Syntrophocurvum alkaliphilum TaxID=2293317 RepID=A0A6I6DBZ5_9FIRM|nr:ATP-binding cassette domain-containing protein [Candidatus Syntrophocurvum alkaliphilum]QGU00136.1 Bis-ABC ATPase YheS [Candidatus Syntrophocurvum alkaliphilum]